MCNSVVGVSFPHKNVMKAPLAQLPKRLMSHKSFFALKMAPKFPISAYLDSFLFHHYLFSRVGGRKRRLKEARGTKN